MTDAALYSPLGEGGQLSGLDEQLLEMARKRMTAEQMYEELGSPSGMSPARCLQRVREIVRAQDYLSLTEQKALLLLDFIKLRDILFDRIEGTEIKINRHGDEIEVESSPGWANALVRVLKEWNKVIESMSADVEQGRSTIQRQHADLFMGAISVMFDRYNLRLEQAGATLPAASDLAEIWEEVMPLGFKSLTDKVLEA